jgi:hypothetical protein
LEKGLERAQVEHGGVRLDLPEVRVDGRVQRQARREPVFDVGAGRIALLATEAVVGDRGDVLGHAIGCDLQPARRGEPDQPGDLAELRGEAGPRDAVERPADAFRVALDVAPDAEPEGVALLLPVAEL